jgi:hypothetical protein
MASSFRWNGANGNQFGIFEGMKRVNNFNTKGPVTNEWPRNLTCEDQYK